jgi:fumarate reductase flavoprotein subunit
METIEADIIIVGAGGGGLRAAIAAAQADPDAKIALLSKVYPMRSHTVAAEGGAAGVVQSHDSLENHFQDTVAGGDWLCDQGVVDYFVEHATEEMVQLEHWGCPWSRKDDGHVNVRAFGGMKIERTWFAADKTGFHILHTLFQTSLQFPNIQRFDEYFCLQLLTDEGRCQGVVAIEIASGEPRCFMAPSVILATGGAGRVFRFNTNAGIVTGDGMAMAYRAGVALRDMEFVQYHPTALPGSGILMTEGCRGEGGVLVNKDGYRYLQDYGLGPPDPWPRKKAMELGPRDRLSQAFWQEQQKGNTVDDEYGPVVHLDLRHLGADYLNERLPLICGLAKRFANVDPVKDPIPVRPAVHYTMGGIRTDIQAATSLPGLWAVGECASVGMHGANRLGSNSLAELLVFGKVAGLEALRFARTEIISNETALHTQAEQALAALEERRQHKGHEKLADIRDAMTGTMEECFGIYRNADLMQEGVAKIMELKQRTANISLKDDGKRYNYELLAACELDSLLDIAEAMSLSALARKESRGSHQRLDQYQERDDENFLQHTLAYYNADGAPEISYEAVNITRYQPAQRVYGGTDKNGGQP